MASAAYGGRGRPSTWLAQQLKIPEARAEQISSDFFFFFFFDGNGQMSESWLFWEGSLGVRMHLHEANREVG
jgi:hypothetical protein